MGQHEGCGHPGFGGIIFGAARCSHVRTNPLALGFSASLGTEGLAAPQKADGKMCFVFVLFFFSTGIYSRRSSLIIPMPLRLVGTGGAERSCTKLGAEAPGLGLMLIPFPSPFPPLSLPGSGVASPGAMLCMRCGQHFTAHGSW